MSVIGWCSRVIFLYICWVTEKSKWWMKFGSTGSTDICFFPEYHLPRQRELFCSQVPSFSSLPCPSSKLAAHNSACPLRPSPLWPACVVPAWIFLLQRLRRNQGPPPFLPPSHLCLALLGCAGGGFCWLKFAFCPLPAYVWLMERTQHGGMQVAWSCLLLVPFDIPVLGSLQLWLLWVGFIAVYIGACRIIPLRLIL